MRPKDESRKAAPREARKILVATLGLASLSLVGCGGFTSGNLVAPPPEDAGPDTNEPRDAGAPDDAGSRK